MGTGRQEGKWTLWVQDKGGTLRDSLVRQPSTRRSNDIGGQHYYDREKRRCLVLDERVIAPFSYSAPGGEIWPTGPGRFLLVDQAGKDGSGIPNGVNVYLDVQFQGS